MQSFIFIALGSNLRNRSANLTRAVDRLEAAGLRLVRASSVHETPALMPEGAPPEWDRPYLNQVIEVTPPDGRLEPLELLRITQGIERELGRQPAARWAPRVIDIDVLAWGDLVLDTPALTLPHPRLHERHFVLAPLCELAPGWMHPRIGATAAQWLARLENDTTGRVR